jgi:restriction system protein
MTLWVVRCGGDSAHELEALEQSYVGIGWGTLGDVSRYDSVEKMREHYASVLPHEKRNSQINCSSQVFSFAHRIQKGDLVALPLKSRRAIAFGRIVGDYKFVGDAHPYVSHQRKVEWIKEPIPRSEIAQDLLYTLGAYLTVFQASRNDAEARIRALLDGQKDSYQHAIIREVDEQAKEVTDIESIAKDQISNLIVSKFSGHAFARLIGEILKAQGYSVLISPEGPDGGVDVLAGSGASGFEEPKIAVQVKSGSTIVDAATMHRLQGTMKNFDATYGLMVSWGGFNNGALKEGRRLFFSVQMWDADDVIHHLTENYDRLSDEIKAEIPLKRIWTVLPDEELN